MDEYFRHMRKGVLLILVAAGLFACTKKDLCERFFEPYPDIIGEREATPKNQILMSAMAAYKAGDFTMARDGFQRVIDENYNDQAARVYLVSCLLALKDPYKAEMHLDFLERTHDRAFQDQVDWYNALCWVCSSQTERALKQAQWIAAKPAHTYKQQAAELAEALSGP
jgi:thioredoxin-like negative regulator of GroEL